MKKNIAITLIAGKLAVSSTQVYSAEGGIGKIESSPGISLTEIGAPVKILTPPDSGSKSGVLYTQLAENQRIDFIINGVPTEGNELQVYLAYSKNAGRQDQWTPFDSGRGHIELDTQSLEVLAGVTVQSVEEITDFPDTPLGSVDLKQRSILLPVALSNLNRLGDDGDRIYFQAIVIPVDSNGNLVWNQGYASEVDSFDINRSLDYNPEYDDYISDGKNSGSDPDSTSGGK